MEKLSIEEKAARYDEAIQRARDVYTYYCDDREQLRKIESIFPELKESEGERIRKELIAMVRLSCTNGDDADKKIAWLEKQGEQNHADKVEPKFKVGDWVVCCDYEPEQIINITTDMYEMSNGDIRPFYMIDDNPYIRPWTIQDAKDGDVLVDQNGEMPFIFKECKNNHVYCYCGYTNRKDVFFDKFVDNKNEELHWLNLYHEQAYPATKEQRDLLLQQMKEAGYEWDAEKLELKKIEQKPDWSEEDEKAINDIMWIIEAYRKNGFNKTHIQMADSSENWLKSLKERVQLQPKQEWSEEDEKMIRGLIVICDEWTTRHSFYPIENCEIEKLKNWLEFLKERYTWKPSDEQMEALLYEVNAWDENSANGQNLRSLYEQLKKLREE